MATKETNSSSANAQSNGWTFQYVAALVIFLENMGKATQFCVEGTEDIVVFLKNNEKICSQAKSGLEQDSIVKYHFDEIIESIRTLSLNDDAVQLISTFNFHKPLGDDNSFAHSLFLDKKTFNNLTSDVQKKIKDKSEEKGYVLNFDKFKLWFIRFEGEEPELGLKNYLCEKLHEIRPNNYFAVNNVMSQWLQIIQLNARDKTKNIDNDVICGTLFGKVLEDTNLSQIIGLVDIELDACYEEDFERFFKSYFSNNSQNFRTYNAIATDYLNYVNTIKPGKKNQYKTFVDAYCKKGNIPLEIVNYFKEYEDRNQLSLDLYKLFVAYVCYRKDLIKSIRRIFGYDDY